MAKNVLPKKTEPVIPPEQQQEVPSSPILSKQKQNNQKTTSSPPTPSKRKSNIVWIGIAIFIFLYIGLNIGVYSLYGMKGVWPRITMLAGVKKLAKLLPPTPTLTPTPTPTPTPIQLPPGKGTYNVSQSTPQGPRISKVSFDPLDVHKGETLIITMATRDTVPIQSIQATLITDNGGQKALQFSRIDGTDLSGNWQSTVTMDDTVWYTYTLQITASSSSGINTFAITPR